MSNHQGSYDLDLDGSFLKDLPPLIKRFTYYGKQQFLDILESEFARFEASIDTSEFLLFYTSKETIEDIFEPQTEDTSIARFCTSFDTDEQLLLVTMASKPHVAAADDMNTMIRQTLIPMGLSAALQGYQGATIRGNSRGKQADYAWGPKRRARDQPSSPSVVLEVAFSESESKLNSDVRFWLNPQDGKANICLTLRINRSRPEIRIESWKWQNNRIHRSQVTWITKDENDQVDVTHHPLTIPFESLFRRPSSRPGEKDIEISNQQLQDVAETIWQEQDWHSTPAAA